MSVQLAERRHVVRFRMSAFKSTLRKTEVTVFVLQIVGLDAYISWVIVNCPTV